MNSLQVSDFQIRLINGKTFNKPFEQLSWLDSHVSRHGLSSVAYITFYFHTTSHKIYYLSLRASDHSTVFNVEFYHYYNERDEKVNISLSQKIRDFTSVMYAINHTGNLNDILGQYIIDPFRRENN